MCESHPADSSNPLKNLPTSTTIQTPTVSPTIFTEEQVTDFQGDPRRLDFAIAVSLVGLAVMIIVLVLIIIVFVLLKKQRRRTKATEVANTEYEEVPDIALSPNIHVEVSERGQIRRRTMDKNKFETQRAQVVKLL